MKKTKHYPIARVAIALRALCMLLILFTLAISPTITLRAQSGGPPLLSYDELVALYEVDVPPQSLQRKLQKLLNTPFINNSAGLRAPRRGRDSAATPGNFIRVAAWNIERGLEFDAVRAALTNNQAFFRRLPADKRPKPPNLTAIADQAGRLSRADIIVLNEVDWGLKRTNYLNIGRELANAMQMNYAYAVEFVEVDPLTLGTETLEGETSPDKAQIVQNIAVDKSRTLGLHGTAILSRFPLRNVRVVRLETQGHDWYVDEKKGVSILEKGKQKGAGFVFGEKILREVRRGNRMMLLAEIESANIPGGALTIVATHLEAKSKPSERRKQLEEVLAQVKAIDHPVVVAGDMNTSGSDSAPISFQREVKKRILNYSLKDRISDHNPLIVDLNM
jgi:endonuclease/exonuclease/phosphatase family metal-dependent hydrolase